MRHTITVTRNQGDAYQVVWDDVSGEVYCPYDDLAVSLRASMAKGQAEGTVCGHGFPMTCKDPYHDPDDFVACLNLYGTVTLPYELRGAEPHVLWEELDPNVVY